MPEWASLITGFIKGKISIGRLMILITLSVLFWSLTPDLIVNEINKRPISFLPDGSNFVILCISGSYVLIMFFDYVISPLTKWCIGKIEILMALRKIKSLSSEELKILNYYIFSGSKLRFESKASKEIISLSSKNIIKNIGSGDPLTGVYAYLISPIYEKAMLIFMSKQ
ncbi:hypothetical protein GKR75_16045 [Providencia sp. wls1919]|nr:hypothetical protein [Providencia sp. wls1919]